MTGSGTIGDPYIISSKADLQAIDSDMTAYYELANDIDCAHAWTTLSSDDFTGHLDGKGFKITHMDINAPADSYLGLFSIISETGTIENLGIEDSTLTGESAIGAFAGYVLDAAGFPPEDYTGHISNCYAKNITIYAIEGDAGSLFGFTSLHDGHIGIYDCWSEDCIIYDGPASDGYLGGFTCLADTGIIERCYVKNVTIYTGSGVSGQCYGGFVGTTLGSTDDALPGTIQECWCSGSVEGGSMVGGFVGDQGFNYKSLIQNCYSRCSVHQLAPDAYLAGGFVGLQRAFTGGSPSGGIILNSYSTGAIVVDLPDDLVVGFGTETFFAAWSEITDCYTDMDTNGADIPGDATGKTTAEMKVLTTFPTWDFSTIWAIVSTCNDGYPCLLNTTPGCLVVAVTYAPAQSPDCENPWYGIVYAPNGGFVGSLQCWISLTLKHTVNAPTLGSLLLDGRDPIIQYLNLDSHVWFYRSNPLLGIKYYREAALFHRSPDQTWDERAQYSYASSLVGYEELLSRRILMGGDDEAYCTGVYSAERAMKQIVEVQCGISGSRTLAVTPSISGLTVSSSSDRGQVWSGYQYDSSVLTYLQEIAEARSMALKVSSATPAAFVFDAHPIPFGADRTTPVVANGRNAAGNIPVIFSEQRGNVSKIRYRHVRDQEGNVALARDSGYSKSTAAATDSPWNARETALSVSAAEDASSAADVRLSEMSAREELELDIIQLPNCCYGKDYFLGDWVSVYVANLDRVFTKVITSVTIRLERNENQLDETVFVECGDRPLQYKDAIQESVVNLTKRLAKAESRLSQLGG